jgi:N-acetylglucosamine-6-sulfatase
MNAQSLMRSRLSRYIFAALYAVSSVAFLLPLLIASTLAQTSAPNIVVFLTDDQTLADQSVMVKTKAMLANQGTTFSSFLATHGLCAPSRATLLTGQYPHNHRVLTNEPPYGGYTRLDHTNTLPLWLQAKGYYTAHIGKYLNGLGIDPGTTWQTRPPGWHNWQALVEGEHVMYNWTMNDNGTRYVAGSSEADYQTDALAARALALIQSRRGKPEPFFLLIAPATPHKETDSPALELNETIRSPVRYFNTFATLPLPKPPSYNEANVRDKPSFIRRLERITPSVESQITKRFRNRREALLAVDDLVQKVVKAVDAAGMLRNTVFVYTSDNGYHFGEHRIDDNKNEVYEESLRVPLIIRGGGFPANATATQLAGMHDLTATLVALANATPRHVMDGRDLKPLALDPATGAGRSLLINAFHRSNYTYAVRTDSGYLYAEHMGSAETELYDLNADPYQLRSQHNNSSYNAIKRRLANLLSTLAPGQAARRRLLKGE